MKQQSRDGFTRWPEPGVPPARAWFPEQQQQQPHWTAVAANVVAIVGAAMALGGIGLVILAGGFAAAAWVLGLVP